MSSQAHSLPPAPPDQDSDVILMNYLRILQRRRFSIISVIVIMMGLAIFYNWTATKIYQARSTVIIRRSSQLSVFRAHEIQIPNYIAERAEFGTKIKIITTRPMMEKLVLRMIEKGNFPAVNNPDLTEKQRERLLTQKAMSLIGSVSVREVQKTNLVDILARNPDKKMAREVANNLADILVEHNVQEQRLVAENSLKFLNEQLEDARRRLEEADSKLYEYKIKHEIFDTTIDKQLIANQRLALQQDLIEATERRKALEAEIGEIRRLLQQKDYSKYTPASGKSGTTLNSLNDQLVQAEIKYQLLIHKYKSEHPDVIEAMKEIDVIKSKFEEELDKGVRWLEAERNVSLNHENLLNEQIASISDSAIVETRKDIEYGVLEREANSARELFNTLLSAVKEANIQLNGIFSDVTYVHEYALTPGNPIWPKTFMNLLIGLFLGVACGVGLALLLESFDRTIKVPEDVEIHAKLPILTLLPKITAEHGDIGKYRLMVLEHPKSLFSEGILNLRANFRLNALNQNLATLMVSSSGPREGKSLIAANLAVAMSQEGVRTLLIDADLRRPVMHKIFRLERTIGLTQSIIDLFQASPGEMDLSKLTFGDLNLLMGLQRRSGMIVLNVNHDGAPLQFLYQKGNIVASNLEEWQRRHHQNNVLNYGAWNDIELRYEESTSHTKLLPMVAPESVNQFFLEFPQLQEAPFLADSLYDNYCHETVVENLKVMTSGPVPSNPSEILGSRQMSEIIRMMKRKVDLIVFDTAPCWPLSDVSLLSTQADALIYVVRSGKISRDLLMRNLRQLRQLELRILGVVFNDVDFQRDRYYYYGYYSHYYHYYYYYYYDHGPEDRQG